MEVVVSPGSGQDDLMGLFHFYFQGCHEYNAACSMLSIVKELNFYIFKIISAH